jgi:hypothetical protein
MEKKPVVEALKEAGRLFLFALAAWVIEYVGLRVTGIAEFLYPWLQEVLPAFIVITPELTITFLTFVIRWLDKYVHVLGKETVNETLAKGISRF